MFIGKKGVKMKKNFAFVAIISILIIALNLSAFASDIPSLIKELGDQNKDKAKRASEELGLMGKPAVSELIKALSSKITNQRRYAARALRKIGQDAADAIPALSRSLGDSDSETRIYAVEALGNMIQQAEEVIPLLQKATRDEHKGVREAVEAAIKKLESYHVEKPEIERRVKERLNQKAGKKCLSVHLEQESPNKLAGFVEFEDGSKASITVTVNGADVQYSFGEVGKDASGKLAAKIPTSQESRYSGVEWKLPDINDSVYYARSIDGNEFGCDVTTRISTGQRVTTSYVVAMALRENDALVRAFHLMTKDIETSAGEPLGFEYDKFHFEKGRPVDRVRLRGTVTQQGKVEVTKWTIEGDVKNTLDWPKGALMSEGERLFFSQKQMEEGQEYSIRRFSPETTGTENYNFRIGKKKKVGLIGGETLLTEVTEGNDVHYYDAFWREQKTVICLKDASNSRYEIVGCSEEHVGNNIEKTEFQRDYELLEEETAEFIRENSGKSLNTMTAIDVNRIWKKWIDLQSRWLWTLVVGKPKEEIELAIVIASLHGVPDSLLGFAAGHGDCFPKVDFMSPKVFYEVFGKPQRTQIAPEESAYSGWDQYYFWYECRDGSIGIKVLIKECTKEKYEVLVLADKGLMSF